MTSAPSPTMYGEPSALDETQRQSRERLRTLAIDFDRKTDVYARTLIFLLIPLVVLLPLLLFARRRDGPVRHLVFITHWMSWFLLVSIVAGWLLSALHSARILSLGSWAWEAVATGTILLLMMAWTLPAMRRVYGLGWITAGLAAFAMMVWLALMLQVYRSTLFFAVAATL